MHLDRTHLYFIEKLKNISKTDLTAIICGDEKMSYRQVWDYSNAIAMLLSEKQDKSPVVIWGDKENEIIPCMFGSIMGGHPYTFIPFYYPAERVSDIISDCGAKTVFALGNGTFPLSGDFDVYDKPAVLNIFSHWNGCEIDNKFNLGYDDTWVIYYTSGSTGKPKGVLISGENIATKVEIIAPYFTDIYTEAGLRAINLSSYAFSISLTSAFSEMARTHSTLYSIPMSTLRDYPRLFEILLNTDPIGFCATPSLVELFLKDDRFSSEYMPSMKYFCFGGEIVNVSTAQKLRQRFKDIVIFNGYGATELSSGPFMCRLSEEFLDSYDGILPIGTDDGNGEYKIVDDDGNELPDGEIGEFVTAGGYVSKGYLNNPEKTAEKFYVNENGVMTFKTGDLMYKKNGMYFYTGRKDNMVKVGGYRVELEDVEQNLRKISIVKQCAAVPVCSGDSVIMLAAYVVLNDAGMSKITAIKQIKSEMSRLVQEYMVPQRIRIVEELPRNNSNKLDRTKLIEENRLN